MRTSQELDFRLIATTKNGLKFTYPGQRLETSSLFRYTLLPGGGEWGVLLYKSGRGARRTF